MRSGNGRWAPGISGNPSGRSKAPPGLAAVRAELRKGSIVAASRLRMIARNDWRGLELEEPVSTADQLRAIELCKKWSWGTHELRDDEQAPADDEIRPDMSTPERIAAIRIALEKEYRKLALEQPAGEA